MFRLFKSSWENAALAAKLNRSQNERKRLLRLLIASEIEHALSMLDGKDATEARTDPATRPEAASLPCFVPAQ